MPEARNSQQGKHVVFISGSVLRQEQTKTRLVSNVEFEVEE